MLGDVLPTTALYKRILSHKGHNVKRIYCLYDRVAATFLGGLVVDAHDAPVIRMFYDLLMDKQTQPGKHPADFDLRYLGQVSPDGTILPSTPPTIIADGATFIPQES